MRVALTGASGFIGSCIARHLAERSHKVNALLRHSSRRDHIEPFVDRFTLGDQTDERSWGDLLDNADCVIHNSVDWESLRDPMGFDAHLQNNLAASIRFIKASMPRQFVFVSTIAVHHDMRPRWAGMIDEDHPTRPGSIYGAYKAAVEAHLWAAHFAFGQPTCALRPCGVYGLDPQIERSHGYVLIEKLKRGERIEKPGGGKFVHVDDVAAAVIATVGNPNANGKVYNLADCYARWADWAQWAADILGVKADIDMSSSAHPQNSFTKDAAMSLGFALDRGHDGIKQHLGQLITRMK